MGHPGVTEILAAAAGGDVSGDLARHLAACASCRALAGLADPLAAADHEPSTTGDEPDLPELPTVDRRLYGGWQELPGGRGGMGRAFRARDRRLGREVAIKELLDPATLPPPLRADARRRFEREARLTARLQHPSIVGIYEAGRWSDGEPFYAMPLVRGRPLEDEIEERRTIAERLTLLPRITAVAEAMAYAHGEGIVHRDIKPQNILVGPFGETILIDWGLATDLRAKRRPEEPSSAPPVAPTISLTKLGVGTPNYMPPEQARGEPPDPRMDVYALGATLYHALAGSPPYGRDPSGPVRERLRAAPPVPLAELVPDVPSALSAIVLKAMARDPAQRFQTARELADELRRYETGQLIRTHRYSSTELLRHWMQRNRAVLRVAAVAALLLAGLSIAGVLGVARERDHAERELEKSRGITASQLAQKPAERLAAIALGVKAVAPRLRAGEPPSPEALQGLVDALSMGPALVKLDAGRAGVLGLRASPDGARLVSLGGDGYIRLWDPRTGRPLAALRTSLPNLHLSHFSPDGRHLAVCGYDESTEVWDLESESSVRLETGSRLVDCPFAPDGAVVTAGQDELVRWDPASGERREEHWIDGNAAQLALSDDGLVAVGDMDGAIHLWDPRVERADRLAGHRGTVTALAFTAGGPELISGGVDGKLLLWKHPLDPGVGPVLLAEDPVMRPYAASAAPGGHRIAAHFHNPSRDMVGLSSSTRIFDLERPSHPVVLDGAWAASWAKIPSREGEVSLSAAMDGRVHVWSPDTGAEILRLEPPGAEDVTSGAGVTTYVMGIGARVAQGSWNSGAYLWDVRAGIESGALPGHENEIVATAVSPAGDRFLTASLDGTTRLWDLRSGAPLAVIRSPAEVVSASFSPDGARVLTAGLDGVARLSDAGGSELHALGAPGEPLSLAAFSPDGEAVLAARLDGTATLFRAATGAALYTLDARAGAVTASAFSPDGARIVTAHADHSVRLWSTATGAPIAERLEEGASAVPADGDATRLHTVASAFFSPDGARILVGFHTGKSVWLRASDLAREGELEGRSASATTPPFSPDGRRVVTVTGAGSVLLHDRERGHVLDGHGRPVLSATFSRDGERLVTASMDGSIRLWDVERRESLLVIDARGLGQATSALLSPDGRWIISSYSSGALRLHPATAGSALARACATLASFDRQADAGGDCSSAPE